MSIRRDAWRRRKAGAALALSGIVSAMSASVTAGADAPASANKTASQVAAKMSSTPWPPNQPPAYAIVNKGIESAPNGTSSAEVVGCPVVSGVQTSLTGGGVFIASLSTATYILGDLFQGDWFGDVSNYSGAATTFTVYGICSTPTFLGGGGTYMTNPAGTQSSATLYCPAGEQVLNGGVGLGYGQAAEFQQGVSVNESEPVQIGASAGWRVYVNNATGADDPVRFSLVCSSYSATSQGYRVVQGPTTVAPTGRQTFAAAFCPVVNGQQTRVLAGGESNNSTSLAVNINSNYPVSRSEWGSYVNNTSGTSIAFNTWAICSY